MVKKADNSTAKSSTAARNDKKKVDNEKQDKPKNTSNPAGTANETQRRKDDVAGAPKDQAPKNKTNQRAGTNNAPKASSSTSSVAEDAPKTSKTDGNTAAKDGRTTAPGGSAATTVKDGATTAAKDGGTTAPGGSATTTPGGSTTTAPSSGGTTAIGAGGTTTAVTETTERAVFTDSQIARLRDAGGLYEQLKPKPVNLSILERNNPGAKAAGPLAPNNPQQAPSVVAQEAGGSQRVGSPGDIRMRDRVYGDEFLVASLQAIENSDPDAFKKMVRLNEDHTYTVSLYDQELKPFEVTVNDHDWPISKTEPGVSENSSLARVAEVAFSKYRDEDGGNQAFYASGGKDHKDLPAFALSTFTGKENSFFNLNGTAQSRLNDELQAGKAVVAHALQDGPGGVLKQDSDYHLPAYSIVDYDSEENEYGAYNAAGEMLRIKASDLWESNLWATVSDGAQVEPVALDRNELFFTREEIERANPELSGKILDWGFEQVATHGVIPERVTRDRAEQLGALGKEYLESAAPLHNVTKLNEGRDGGILKGLNDSGIGYEDVSRFVANFRTSQFVRLPPDNRRVAEATYDFDLLKQYTNNTKHVDQDAYIPLWNAGVKSNVIASLADSHDGGLLKDLHQRKLGTEGVKSALDRVVNNDSSRHFIEKQGFDDLRAFNDIAKHKPNEWAQNLLKTNLEELRPITEILDFKVLGDIIDDRHVGAQRIAPVVDWAYSKAGEQQEQLGDAVIWLDSEATPRLNFTRSNLEMFNDWAKSRPREEVWARIASGNFDDIIG